MEYLFKCITDYITYIWHKYCMRNKIYKKGFVTPCFYLMLDCRKMRKWFGWKHVSMYFLFLHCLLVWTYTQFCSLKHSSLWCADTEQSNFCHSFSLRNRHLPDWACVSKTVSDLTLKSFLFLSFLLNQGEVGPRGSKGEVCRITQFVTFKPFLPICSRNKMVSSSWSTYGTAEHFWALWSTSTTPLHLTAWHFIWAGFRVLSGRSRCCVNYSKFPMYIYYFMFVGKSVPDIYANHSLPLKECLFPPKEIY